MGCLIDGYEITSSTHELSQGGQEIMNSMNVLQSSSTDNINNSTKHVLSLIESSSSKTNSLVESIMKLTE